MKFNLQYVKKNPVMFGAIFLVFGLLIWLLINRGASSGSTQYVTQGPSEALQAAQLSAGVALQGKQIDASVQTTMAGMQLEALTRQLAGSAAIANMEMQYRIAELGENSDLGRLQIQASLAALDAQLDNNLAITNANNSFMIGYASQANQAAVQTVAINAALQRELSRDQKEAFQTGAIMSALPAAMGSAMDVDRDNVAALFAGLAMGKPMSYSDQWSGSFQLN